MRLTRIVFATLVLALLAACAPASAPAGETVYTRVSEATLQPGDPIPAPQGDVVLSISGLVNAAGGEEITMDLAALEAAGLVDYTVEDPFLHRQVTYRGPLLSELLDLWQVDSAATTLHIVALNDYSIEVPIAMARDYPLVFAIMADGEYMSIADRGPAMLVLPYDDFEFERPAADAYWIWQIKSIEVR